MSSEHLKGRTAQRPRIQVLGLRVKRDRIVARVQVDPANAYSTPALARRLIETHPDLPNHACVNPKGDRFGDVIAGTSLPHVLEHLVIDLQTQVYARRDPNRVFTGITRWVQRDAGLAQVAVSYRDDLVALRAFRDAAALLNRLR